MVVKVGLLYTKLFTGLGTVNAAFELCLGNSVVQLLETFAEAMLLRGILPSTGAVAAIKARLALCWIGARAHLGAVGCCERVQLLPVLSGDDAVFLGAVIQLLLVRTGLTHTGAVTQEETLLYVLVVHLVATAVGSTVC